MFTTQHFKNNKSIIIVVKKIVNLPNLIQLLNQVSKILQKSMEMFMMNSWHDELIAIMILRLIIFDLQKNFLCLSRILIIKKINKKHINKKLNIKK